MPRHDGAVDLHAPHANTGVRIEGGNFKIDKLKREIRIFGENAHTFLEIQFIKEHQQQVYDPSGPDPNGEDQQQQFIFPFSADKSLTYFHARYLNSTYEEIQTITTTLKEKDKARKEYNKAVQNRDFSAIVTSNSDFRGDEYTIEMGNKPEHTEFIVVQLEYSEPLKPEMRVDERLLSLTVQRHKKKRFKSFDLTNARVNIQAESEPEEPSRWIDEVVIIECLGENANTGGSESMISRIELDDDLWEAEEIDGSSFSEGRRWKLRELLPGEQYEIRIINGQEKRMPKRAPLRNAVKNDLEFRFYMKSKYNPVVTIQSIGSDARFGNEEEAIISFDLSEENIRDQLSSLPEPMEVHGNCNIDYDSNNGPVIPDDPIMEYIFLVDCSGSMSGAYMDNTKRTMELILKSLEHMSRIIICRFGTRYEFQPRQNGGTNEELDEDQFYNYRFRPHERRAVPNMRNPNWMVIDEDDEDQEEFLMKYLEKELKANMGGTNIQEPLLDIFNLKMSEEENVYRNIIVMTDGAITNTNEVIRMVRERTIQHEGRLRFFSLGIGSGASKSLCEGIAKNGRGSAVYVLGKDRIQTKASQIMQNASRNDQNKSK